MTDRKRKEVKPRSGGAQEGSSSSSEKKDATKGKLKESGGKKDDHES
jgi:hypothetical protein